MVRKRAPGGGRKPIGPTAARPLTIRIDDDLRGQLGTMAHKRASRKAGWNLSQEILRRLRWSIDREREDRRDPALRAINDIIAGMARSHLQTDRPGWHREPFTFRAFKLAVAKLLDALEPAGKRRPPSTKFSRNIFSPFDTPESLAEYAFNKTLISLFNDAPMTNEERASLRASFVHGRDQRDPLVTEYALQFLGEYEQGQSALSRIRRVLGIKEPKEPKL